MSRTMFKVGLVVALLGACGPVLGGSGVSGGGLSRWGAVAAPGAGDLTIGTPLLTLADVARQEKNPFLRAIKLKLAEGFYKANHWGTYTKLQKIGYQKITSGHAASLPTPDRVALNQALDQIGIDLGTHEAHAAFFGNEFTNQKMIGEQPGMMDALQQKLELYVKAVAASSNNDFLFGDPAVDPKAFPGLAYRIANPDRFKIAPIVIDLATGGVPLDLTMNGMSTANASKFARAIEDIFGDIQAGNGTDVSIITNRHGMGGLPAAMREAKRNLYPSKEAEFGMSVTKFGDASIYDIGQKPGVGSADANMILKPAGNGATDVYVVNWGNFKAWQTNDMTVMKTPPKSNVYDFYEFLWGCGAIEQSAFCYGVIKNVKWR